VLDFTLSSLWRRKGKNLALYLLYTVVVFSLASVMFLTASLKREAGLLLQGSPEMVVQRLVAGRHELIPASYAEPLRTIRGVATVRGRLWGYYYDSVSGANFTLLVPPTDRVDPGTVFIGNGVARARGVGRGDRLSFRTFTGVHVHLPIAGTFAEESELLTADLVLVSEEDFRQIFGIPEGSFTDLTLEVRNLRELATIAGKIQTRLPDTRTILRDDILRTYSAVFDWRSGLLILILAACVLAFAIVVWDKASGLSAEEKREIGILKAVGWETGDVILLKFWEGAVISLSSFLSGILLAYAHVYLAAAPLLAPVLKGWSTLYPRFRLLPVLDPYLLGVLFLLAVVPYTVATIVPSWRVATTDPGAAMRG
jgi:ABC-type lipoprotein release transport system permease subunit